MRRKAKTLNFIAVSDDLNKHKSKRRLVIKCLVHLNDLVHPNET